MKRCLIFLTIPVVIMTFAFNLFRPVIAANLVDKNTMAYWPFDENSGKITKDSTANGIVGQIEKAEWAKGFSGSALNLMVKPHG